MPFFLGWLMINSQSCKIFVECLRYEINFTRCLPKFSMATYFLSINFPASDFAVGGFVFVNLCGSHLLSTPGVATVWIVARRYPVKNYKNNSWITLICIFPTTDTQEQFLQMLAWRDLMGFQMLWNVHMWNQASLNYLSFLLRWLLKNLHLSSLCGNVLICLELSFVESMPLRRCGINSIESFLWFGSRIDIHFIWFYFLNFRPTLVP